MITLSDAPRLLKEKKMKKMMTAFATLALSFAMVSPALAGDRHNHSGDGDRHGRSQSSHEQHRDRYVYQNQRHDTRQQQVIRSALISARQKHDRDQYRYDNRRSVQQYRYETPRYTYDNYRYSNGYYNRSYVPTRYNSPQYYYGDSYVYQGHRYYDQCSNSDTKAIATVLGAVLGGALGNQVSDSRAAPAVGAVLGGLVAGELVKNNRHDRYSCW